MLGRLKLLANSTRKLKVQRDQMETTLARVDSYIGFMKASCQTDNQAEDEDSCNYASEGTNHYSLARYVGTKYKS